MEPKELDMMDAELTIGNSNYPLLTRKTGVVASSNKQLVLLKRLLTNSFKGYKREINI